VPLPAGRSAAYRLPAVSRPVAMRRPVGRLRCGAPSAGPRYGVHLELYAARLVVPVPAGIGIAPPQRRRGAYVLGGACVYPMRTFEPTGVVVVDHRASSAAPTLGALFAVWGQPLSRGRLAGFRGSVTAYLGGARWSGPPGAIPLTRHAEIVLEVGGAIPPHRTYLFPPGL
jgi:hypothetical protein